MIREYAEQTREVAAARSRLAVLSKTADTQRPAFRKIEVPTKLSGSGSGKLSPDGQTLAFIEDGSLWTVSVHGKSDPNIAGAPVRLTDPVHAWDGGNVSVEWSADGKWIGFRVAVPRIDEKTPEELFIVPAGGGTPRRVPITWQDWAEDVYTLRYALSSGADVLYFADGSTPPDMRVYSMPTRGGERRALSAPFTRQPALSPDGSRVAYVRGEQGEAGHLDTKEIWVAAADGTGAQLAYKLPGERLAWVQGPIWSPDGKMLAFLASSRGNRFRQVLVLPLRNNGTSAAEPARFDLPTSEDGTSAILAGWPQDNRIGVLIRSEEQTAIYRVPAAGGRAFRLTPKAAWMPAWSPDGTRIYFDGTHREDGWAALEYVPAEGGTVERLERDQGYEQWQPAYPHAGISLSPDGHSICLAAFSNRDAIPAGLFIVPTRGGRPTRLTTGPEREPQWSPDGTQIAFISPDPWNIFVMPRNGERRQVTTNADRVQMGSLAWSPDGTSLAFFSRDGRLRVVPAQGGASRVLADVAGSLRMLGLGWSPDGRWLAYASGGSLWRILADGGTPQRIETGLDARIEKITWSPDGKDIAFGASRGGEYDLWLMEDFIHLAKAAR